MDNYVTRVLDRELDDLLPVLAAISIDGPKGVGKTTTAMRRAATIFRLDDPATLELVLAEPARMIEAPAPVLIDEWQRWQQSWDLVRRAVDENRQPGRFILTGSASPRTPATHSGAGRIIGLRMRPLTLAERWDSERAPTVSLTALLNGERASVEGTTDVGLADYIHEIVAGGFPAMRELPERARLALMDGYLDRIVDTDFPEAGYTARNPSALRRWMEAHAALTATDASYETIRDAATNNEGSKPSRVATKPYNDTLERLWLVDPVPAWLPTNNRVKRLTTSSKHHLADPALAVGLLRIGADALLRGQNAGPPVVRDGTLAGALFESLIALNLRVYSQAADAKVHHFRTKGGEREVDFIVERRDRKVLAIEVKLKKTVESSDAKHLHWLKERLGGDLVDAVIVTTGREAYRRQDGIAVVPASLLGP